MTSSEYFRRNWWISFDPGEEALLVPSAETARRGPHHLGRPTIPTPTPSTPASSQMLA